MAKLLLVDDDPLLSRMYQDKFTEDGYEVVHGSDGEEGLAKLATFKPDLILMDMMMPKMDGLQALEKLKANPDTKKIPVIMLTNVSSEHNEAKKGLELGAIAYLVKGDYSPVEVVKKVKEILAGYVSEAPKVEVAIKE